MHHAHVSTCGGYVSDEVKLGITLQMLACGDTLDLGTLFDISSSRCQDIFIDIIDHWIGDDNICEINMRIYMNDPEAPARVSHGF